MMRFEWGFERLQVTLGRKKVTLILDNAPDDIVAPILSKLKVTKVYFLLTNTTSRFQPMDMRIIHSFKCQYCRLMIKKQVKDFEANKVSNIDVYHVVIIIMAAWEQVTTKTIEDCWGHCNFMP